MCRFLRIFAVVLCVGAGASATTWYVDGANTTGAEDGLSWATAFTAIQQGIDATSAGDRVLVRPGTYVENVHVDGKDLVLQSINPADATVAATTVIDGDGNAPVVTFDGGEPETCRVSGFTLTNGAAARGAGVLGNGTRAAIDHNVIRNNHAVYSGAADSGLGGGLYGCRGLIRNNTIADNVADKRGGGLDYCPGTLLANMVRGNSAENGGAAYACDGLIDSNQFFGNAASANGGALSTCSGIVQNNFFADNSAVNGGALHACHGVLRNNTLSNNSATGFGSAMYFCDQTAVIVNNIVWRNLPVSQAQLTNCSTPQFCCIQYQRPDENGNFSADPRFVAPDQGNFHLRAASPCIDAGTAIIGLDNDIDGDARDEGSAPDIGADEFVGVVDLEYTRTIPGWTYAPGQALVVSVAVNTFADAPIASNFTMKETLPEGWYFSELGAGAAPDGVIVDANTVAFSWSALPPFPFTFDYVVAVPEGTTGEQEITGQAAYTANGFDVTSRVIVNALLDPNGGGLSKPYIEQLAVQGETLQWTFDLDTTDKVTDVPLNAITGDDSSVLPDAPEKGRRKIVVKDALPAAFDWRDTNGHDYLTDIRDQKQCGSCWAFSTNAVMESVILMHEGVTVDLSEQYLVSCNTNLLPDNVNYWGCSGGSRAFDYYMNRQSECNKLGPVTELQFPYTATEATPNCASYTPLDYLVYAWGYIQKEPDVALIKQALLDYGPLFVSMNATEEFQSYKGGVFNYDDGKEATNHGVVIAGWDDSLGDEGAWIVKNSWGKEWGDHGYVYMAYGASNIGTWATWVDYDGQATGSLHVTIAPQDAVTAGAQWRVDGGSWRNSGATLSDIVAGTHEISFKTVTGWDAPASFDVEVEANATADAEGTYTPSAVPTGTLQVTLSPAAAVTAGAQWRVDGGDWRNSGQSVLTTAGAHTVSYKAVLNWTAPGDDAVDVIAAATTPVQAAYVAAPAGAVRITIAPQGAIDAGAFWQLDGGGWRESGTAVSGVSVGTHAVTFNTINGWTAPGTMSLEVEANQIKTSTGTYTQQLGGTVNVTLFPLAAVNAGAQWKVDNGAWQSDGTSLDAVPEGNHTIAFKQVSGWITPESQSLYVDSDLMTMSSGFYAEQVTTGSLRVDILPAGAVAAGAFWRLDASSTWHTSGEVVNDLSAGAHTIYFNAIPGWTAPAAHNVTIVAGATTPYQATYTQIPEGEEGEGTVEGEGMPEGEGAVEGEGMPEGEGMFEGEGTEEGDGEWEGEEGEGEGGPGPVNCCSSAKDDPLLWRHLMGDLFLGLLSVIALVALSRDRK